MNALVHTHHSVHFLRLKESAFYVKPVNEAAVLGLQLRLDKTGGAFVKWVDEYPVLAWEQACEAAGWVAGDAQ